MSNSVCLSTLSILTVLCVHCRGKRTQLVSPQTTPKRLRLSVERRTLDTSSLANVSPLSSPSVPVDNNDDCDDDIVILETSSTPKPKKPDFDLNKVKTEQGQSDADINMLLECSDDDAVDKLDTNAVGTSSTGSPAVATSPSPAHPPELASVTTQTEMLKVKKEEEDQNQTEERAGQSTSNKDALGENQEKDTLQNGVTHHPESDEAAGPFWADACNKKYPPPYHPSITEVQEQQDQVMELMQATVQERDSFKEEVGKLKCQLQDMQSRLQELSQISVKKECSHQASQTEETVETERGEDYKTLFEKAKQKVDELIEDKKALLAATETKSSIEEKDIDEISLHVDCLLRELDQRNKEKDELRSQVSFSFVV